MPYKWTSPQGAAIETMELHPHQSLPARGMAAFVLSTFTLILIPALAMLGSPVLWGLLPFLMLAVWGVFFALQQNYKSRLISEILTLDAETTHLVRTNPKGDTQVWECNRYWTQVTKHEKSGPVPQYVTLRGMGREVEIGAFLSEEERINLFDDLRRALKRQT